MEKAEFRKNAADMIYLTRCSLHNKTPDKSRVENMDIESLFEVCQKHILTVCVAYALESAGIHDHDFTQAKEKAIRKNILLDAERRKIFDCMENKHIWYMPLKGALIKDWYPKLGMRQMSDNDILFDGNFRAEVKDIMTDMGFECEHYGDGNVDEYFKKPVCNFEMHNELFVVTSTGRLHEYYKNVKKRLVRDTDKKYGYHFSDEDFYIYITAHEYKHYKEGGTGIRSLADTYILVKKFGNSLDRDYIDKELNRLGIADYDKTNRKLAMKIFDGKKLTADENKELDYYVMSGTYGNSDNFFRNKIESNFESSKIKYILRRIFPPMSLIQAWYPFFYRHKWLIPVLWICRPFFKIKNVIKELKYLINRK
ncbi:MAG TPA: hypothetical protein DCG30_01135 [Ruminococcus sp.]|nr:hypothetical protein [Ruminococcus sp.]